MKARIALIGVVSLVLLTPVTALAQGWDFSVRALGVMPNDSSETILDTGSAVAVDDGYTLGVDLDIMFNERWGLEILAAAAEHDLKAKGGALAGADAGSVWVMPPTFTLQYHLPPSAGASLYVGLGLNFATFLSYDLSSDLQALGVSDITFTDSWGVAGNVGVDVGMGGNWFFNVDAKYITMSTEADLRLADGASLDKIKVEVNPFVFGVGFGYRFR